MTEAMAQVDGQRHALSTTMRHIAAIQALADQLQRPLDEVAAIYQCELVHMGAHAAVTDFLPVLVSKRVRQLYQRRLAALDDDDPCCRLLPSG